MNFFRAISNLLRFDRTNWKALTLCFIAAGVFWMFNALNKNYATNVRVPIQFEFDNKRFVAVDPLPSSIALNVSGNGWDLIRKRLGVKVPAIVMPVERPADTRKIVASSLAPLIASQVGSLKVNFIVTDTLRLKIEPIFKRRFRLYADLSGISFKKDLGRTGSVNISPDSVTLEGPKSIIEALPDSIALNVRGARIAKNVKENAEVIVSNDLISRNPPVAEVMFDVGPVIEITRYAKLITSKAPWGTEIEEDSIRCTFRIPEIEKTNFLRESVIMTLSLEDLGLEKGQTKNFMPSLKKIPAYATLTHADSVSVKRY